MIDTDILIVGLGPTGLGAAWRLSAVGHQDWLACEAEGEAGGLAGSFIDEHGFTWDYGGHVQFSHYEYFDELMDDLLGVDGWHHHDRESWVWMCGLFVPYPFQLNVHRLQVGAGSGLDGLIHAARRQLRRRPTSASGSIMSSGRGSPISSCAHTTPRCGRVLPNAWRGTGSAIASRLSMCLASSKTFALAETMCHGVRTTASDFRVVAARAPSGARSPIGCGARTPIASICTRRVRLDTARAARISVTVPACGMSGFFRRCRSTCSCALSDLAPVLAPALEDLEYSSTHVIGVGLSGTAPEQFKTKCWMYFPESNCPFYRVTHFSHYAPANVVIRRASGR